MVSCGGLVSTILWAIFLIQVIKTTHSKASTNVTCIGAEREALLKFKHGLTDPWRRLKSWTGEECCQWEGVECNTKTGHVLKLDLHNPCIKEINSLSMPSDKCKLGGNMDPSLTKLKYLKHLDLGVNNFSTQKIPMFFASLQKLEYINLSYACFDGNIPRQLNNFSKLLYLDLSGGQFLGYLTSNDLDWLSKLSSLKYLHMSFVDLSKAKDWFGSINMLSSLQYLGLNSCGLQDVPSSLMANFTSLKFLYISDNNINSSIPQWIYNLSKLEHIDLSFNSLNEGCFPMAIIENNQRLAFFDASRNSLQGEFPKNMSRLCKLQVLQLSLNYLNGNISVILHHPLGCRQSKWKIFDVSHNKFSGDLPNQFGDFKELELLDLSFNSISGSIPTNLGGLSSLRRLYLRYNKLIGTIPESIGQLSNLKELDFGFNLFISDDILDWLYNISSNIAYLDFSSNLLRGQVPKDIGDKMPQINDWATHGGASQPITHLQTDLLFVDKQRRISGESLSRSVLFELLSFNHSKALLMARLNGRIPKSSCHLQQLSVLCLQRNGFTGETPNCLSNMPNMVVLDLSDNEFIGRLPPFGLRSSYLEVINLEKNRFVRGIPPQYCQLKYLQFLSLKQNNISGTIPNCFDGILSMVNADAPRFHFYTGGVDVVYFYSIDRSANMLDGQIPKEFTKLVKLENLNLSRNKLSGYIPSIFIFFGKSTIPPSISSIDFLSHLNLSFNRLYGPIPSSNHLRTVDDESVYRGNDGLCGAPLLNICPGDEPPSSDGRNSDNSNGDKPSEGDLNIRNWFYAGLAPGFTIGFLGFCSVLHFKGSWRISYFRAMDKAIEKFSMTTVIAMLWFKRTFRRCEKELV
ncbi:hypothetical protein BT93_F0003 [Corymbia citriodora subsp. variegata]|nr:hypothetical protein BT93_F0003 [Corymbia citriodora subsp. variegata]